MKIILHRGNLTGPNPETENSPEQILRCIQKGYDVEIDLWRIDGILYFGHDNPTYKTNLHFLHKYRHYLWVHCKNVEALGYMSDSGASLNYFWHQEDQYTITSWDYIWSYPKSNSPYFKNQILLDFSKNIDFEYYKTLNVAGVCVDYEENI